jgi:hypothetical protein
MSRLHLGINVCFAVKRWPEPEQWIRIVKDELGLDCCQFSLDLVDPLLDESATMAYADTVRELAAAHELFILHELQKRLAALSHYAARQGLSFLLFENMAVTREWGYSIEEAEWITNLDTDGGVPLVLCLDVGHPCALHTGTASDDYLAWFARPWAHLPIVHLQQTDRTGDHHWPFTSKYNAQGMIRAESILQAIEPWLKIEDVFLFLEPIHPFEAGDNSVLDELSESVEYWRDALAKL